jgi:hypothetical protein
MGWADVKDMKDETKVRGGLARAEALPPEQRREIARKAAEARWSADLPHAMYEGDFRLGAKKIVCAVLEDETRIITQATFLRVLGRSRSPKAGTGVLSTVDELPFFLQAENIKALVDNDLIKSTRPIFYRTKSGGRGVGYNALTLKRVAEVYLRFRDECLAKHGNVPGRYQRMVAAADLVIRGSAEVGIVALVDEATGYQDVRQRYALQEVLDAFLRKELAAWAKRFPDEFYKQIYRLRGWEWKGRRTNPPQVVAHYTNDFVYERLLPGVREELERRMPRDDSGRKKGKLHQLFTDDVGHPALAQHLHAVTTLMRASRSWAQFKSMLNQALPRRGDTLPLPFVERD